MRDTTRLNVSVFSARFIKMVSAPNISGTSVRMVVPPCPMSQSENLPCRGLAVIPENPSLPPHLSPTLSNEMGRGWRWSFFISSTSSLRRESPTSISSSTSWAIRKRTRDSSQVCITFLKDACWLFSQPRLNTSTPPALGCLANAASPFWVLSRSSPNWEHP